jgi:hypothetical protein
LPRGTFAVCNDSKPADSELINGEWSGIFTENSEIAIITVAVCEPLDKIKRSWDTPDRPGRMMIAKTLLIVTALP